MRLPPGLRDAAPQADAPSARVDAAPQADGPSVRVDAAPPADAPSVRLDAAPQADGPSVRVELDRIAAGIAAEQHGVVTREQLVAAGASAKMIRARVRRGRLRPLHRGVYLVGSIAPPLARPMAAVFACGPSAVVSHRSAAVLWQLVDGDLPDEIITITVAGGDRRHSGVDVRRSRTLLSVDRTRLKSVPVTTVARTLLDLSVVADRRTVERASAEALARRLTTTVALGSYLRRRRGKPGSARLRAVLSAGPPALTRSEAEERFLGLIRRAGIPRPKVNTRVGRYEVDFLWSSAKLVVEVDGFASHHSGPAFEKDRRRDGHLMAQGFQVMRITWRQIVDEPEAIAYRVGRVLGGRG